MWTVLYWTRSSRTQFGMSINVRILAGVTLNITCNFLYCNHHRCTENFWSPCIYPQSLKMLGLLRSLTFSLSVIDSLLLSHFNLVLNWHIAITSQLLKPISWNASNGSLHLYTSLAFSPLIPSNYVRPLEILKLNRRLHFDALFIRSFLGSKFCPSLIDNINLRVPSCSVWNVTQFYPAGKNCLSAGYATAANLKCSNTDIFRRPIRFLKQILHQQEAAFVSRF